MRIQLVTIKDHCVIMLFFHITMCLLDREADFMLGGCYVLHCYTAKNVTMYGAPEVSYSR